MKGVPDCMLLPLEDAIRLLEDAGTPYAVTDISPPQRTCRYDHPRVLRQVADPQGVIQLAVADFISQPVEPPIQHPIEQAPETGVYVLEMRIKGRIKLRVGALGPLRLSAGTYLYVGSARRCLPERLSRHFAADKTLRWHIDYLSARVQPMHALVWTWAPELECSIAHVLADSARPVDGFGCSDCSCNSHLFALRRPSRLWWAETVGLEPPACIVVRSDIET